MLRSHRFGSLLACVSAISLAACATGDDASTPPRPASATSTDGALVIVTEREGVDELPIQYLHVVADWPRSGELDYGRAVEIGEAVQVRAHEGAVYVYRPEEGRVEKYDVNEDLEVSMSDEISFAAHGIMGFDADTIWVSRDVAFLLDEASGRVARWNPDAMEIDEVEDIDWEFLDRGGLNVHFQQGIADDDRLYVVSSWRDWETYETHPGVALAIFDQDEPAGPPTLAEDSRCAPSTSLDAFDDADGNVYVLGDGGLGFDVFASPMKTELPQCVLRLNKGEDDFDPDFFVDLQEATGSPGFYTAHPMADRKLLVNIWSPEVDVDEVADAEDPNWYWDYPPYFEYAIVDLETKRSTAVPDLPRGGVQFSTTLRVGDQNYVQSYREDGGSVLYRVDPDATVTEVLEGGEGTDVQYLGRL